jgi:tetrameric-type glycyl-tRNA synthetase beta subunit
MAKPRTASLLLEIGTEELPPMAVGPALEQLARETAAALADARLDVAVVATTGTLRRLVVTARGLSARQRDLVTDVRGPAARIAFDAAGAPTTAAVGFARSQGVSVDALQIEDRDGGQYVVARKHEPGRPTVEILAERFPKIIMGLAFPKSMRWSATSGRFGRPIRWVLALLDGRVIPLEMAGLRAGRKTVGHRFLAPRTITVASPSPYAAAMRRAHVVLDHAERRTRIVDGAHKLARDVGGVPVIDPGLCEELVWSTEHPTPLLGSFDVDLAAQLPREVVVVTLQHHQKCFGVQDAHHQLLPAFIAVRDGGSANLAAIRRGHESVVRARLEDARFFLDDDLRGSFDRWNIELSRLAHVAGLGTVADHVARLQRLAAHLADLVGLDAASRATVARAASLCKADLVTALVGEFPELQGTVGRIYALRFGEPAAVAAAIEEHYWPTGAGTAVPATPPGAILAVADRALLIVGAHLAGLAPTGSQDPYGVRRAASGVVAVLNHHRLHLSLREMLRAAAGLHIRGTGAGDAGAAAAAVEAAAELVRQRLRAGWLDAGIAYDTADAVLAAEADDIVDLQARLQALHAVRRDPVMPRLATGFARASRILAQGEAAPAVDAAALEPGEEAALHRAWQTVAADVERAAGRRDYDDALRALARLAEPIDRFFDKVLVMAPDPTVRRNRLALLRAVTNSFLNVADFGKLAG